MQFHLNGFRPGDPRVAEADVPTDEPDAGAALPAEVDVLIVGCGPAGLTLGAQLSAFPSIRTLIVEQKAGPLVLGQADGVACRTMEMFEAFGFAERVVNEAYWVNETTFWKPDADHPEQIVRSSRVQDTEDGLSEFPHVILNQARVHDFLLDVMLTSTRRMAPHYERRLVDLIVDPEPESGSSLQYPVAAILERLGPAHAGKTDVVRARYVVGCDGARSAVRAAIGRPLRGEAANQAWGVMDVLAVTDFPDIRFKCAIQSASAGNLLIIPREGGYLVRVYVELDKLDDNERVASRNITSDYLIEVAQHILSPYSLDVSEVVWWSVYEIGQRLCEKFDNLPEGAGSNAHPHVFICGDACHTHSPKAGQGMNVSMADGFNLAWKLAAVIQGRCVPSLLRTYSEERHAVASELINFDREWAAMFSAPPTTENSSDGGIAPAVFQAYFVRHARFTAGTATRYSPSVITAAPDWQHLATGFEVGMRFHSAPVIRLADAKPVHLGHTARADGRWRLFAFGSAGDAADMSGGIGALCTFLRDGADSPVRRFTPAGADIDAVIDVRAVFQQGHREIDVGVLPELLVPRKGRYGLRDYEKVFCPDLKSGADVFEMRGIDRASGCMVVVRPDQHVAQVLPLDGFAELVAFFAGFMVN